MAKNTKSYLAFKTESERLTNLVVLFSHAVPVLKRVLDSPDVLTMIPLKPADNFPHDRATGALLVQWANDYDRDLARIIVLTVFSNFEAYVRAVLLEVFERQGGVEKFIAVTEKRSMRFWKTLPPAIAEAKNKLQMVDEKGKADRARKYSKILAGEGFAFPPDLLSVYGARKLAEKLDMRSRSAFRAWEIPQLLSEAPLFKVSDAEREMYKELRILRNDVGHASPTTITVHEAIKKTVALRKWASKIDEHIAEHFLVLSRYSI